jgi:hypothetical protein
VVGPSPGSGEAEAPPRSRSSLSSEVEVEPEPWGQARRSSSSSGAEAESEPWGRARRSFLWRPRPDLAAVSLTLSSGTAVGATRAALSSCKAGQWSGEVTAVTSAQSTEGRALGHLCIKYSCDTVGWRGDLVKVASRRRLGLGRAEGVSVA